MFYSEDKAVSCEILNEYQVLVTYESGLSRLLGIFHYNTEEHTILCDDFTTFLQGV